MDPVFLYLNLNVAIYKVEVSKLLNEAIEDLESLMGRISEQGNLFKLDIADRRISKKAIKLVQKNIEKWSLLSEFKEIEEEEKMGKINAQMAVEEP